MPMVWPFFSRTLTPSTARKRRAALPKKPAADGDNRPRRCGPSRMIGALSAGGCLAAARLGGQQHFGIVCLSAARRSSSMRPRLDHLAAAHDGDAIGEMPDDAEIVGDEHDGHAETLLQRAQEIEDLRLDRHVERRRRLVRDQESGSLASAMAIITRWRWPPDISCG